MATIETAVRAMLLQGTTLSAAGIADANVSHGYRLQDGTLPALTFEVEQDEILCIGATPLRSARVEIRVIALTTTAALGFLDDVQTVCDPGTYDTFDFDSVIWLGHTIDPATVADGDEAQPAELICNIEITYTE